ncbi:ABC-2 type transport system permease protein [Schaalia radingae]|uniref:ABC-2 type transport system permease protein n=1 Tax=Schaalia radingae TaxID=131110 RepID=A0ABY0V6A4_9ACTO|nr:ABC-2 type transport system permease protein [Schaalia radingae]
MNTSSFRLIWRYQAVWILRSYGTWMIGGVFVILALTQGLFTQYTPRIIRFLAGSEVTTLIESLPEPSWLQAYAGWIKNLTQILTVILVAMNSFRCSVLTGNGDIPFFFPGSVQRSHYLISFAISSWLSTLFLAVFSATLAWAGTSLLFPGANPAPIILASLVWALQIILIHVIQTAAATVKPGIGIPLAAGFGAYLLITMSAIFVQEGDKTPLGLAPIINNLAQDTLEAPWIWPITSSLLLIIALLFIATYIYNRAELD